MKGPSAMLWNYDVSDKEEAERMASLYGEDGTRVVEPGTETETGRNLVRRCGTEGIDMWTVAQEIAKTVPQAKPAEEEPTQTRGPKL